MLLSFDQKQEMTKYLVNHTDIEFNNINYELAEYINFHYDFIVTVGDVKMEPTRPAKSTQHDEFIFLDIRDGKLHCKKSYYMDFKELLCNKKGLMYEVAEKEGIFVEEHYKLYKEDKLDDEIRLEEELLDYILYKLSKEYISFIKSSD